MPTFGDLISHATFTHLFFPEYWSSINGSLWMMSLEMQLYLLFPLLLLAAARWGWPVLVGAIVVSVLFRVGVELFVPGPDFPHQFPPGRRADWAVSPNSRPGCWRRSSDSG